MFTVHFGYWQSLRLMKIKQHVPILKHSNRVLDHDQETSPIKRH